MDIRLPLFKDERTPEFLVDLPEAEKPKITTDAAGRPTIHMDAMAFGMGCCCLQVTFQVSCRYHRHHRGTTRPLAPYRSLSLCFADAGIVALCTVVGIVPTMKLRVKSPGTTLYVCRRLFWAESLVL